MQATALFSLPGLWVSSHGLEASEWRTRWVGAGVGSLDDWNHLRVVVAREMLWIIASNPTANVWLMAHIDAIAGVVATTVNDAVPLQVRQRAIGVRTGTEELWAYRFPRLVVAKGSGDWTPHFAAIPDPGLLDGLARTIEKGIRRELQAWGRLPSMLDDPRPFLVLSQPGRPVVIPAITAQRSGHGKPVNVLARAHLTVLSPLRLEGEIFVGPLASLGYGRMVRTTAPDMLDRATQTALLGLPDFSEAMS